MNVISFSDKFFCQDSCKDKYTVENLVTCQRKPFHSLKPFLKKDAVRCLDRWFCSEACCELDEEVKQLTNAENNKLATTKKVEEEDDAFLIDMEI